MADLRNFAKIDLGYFDNPKTIDLVESQPRAIFVHQRAILYCRQHLTDGLFPTARVARSVCAAYCGSECDPHSDEQCDVCAARASGLIHRLDDRHDEVHDYLEHQDSAAQAERRKSAGQQGARARWDAKRKGNRNADRIPDRIPDGNADGNAEKRREEKSNVADLNSRRKKPPTAEDRDDITRMLDYLDTRITGAGLRDLPKRNKTNLDAARLLLDRDKRDPQEVRQVIDWAFNVSDFWPAQLGCIASLRKGYDQIRGQMRQHETRNGTRTIGYPDQPLIVDGPPAHLVKDGGLLD